MNTCVSAGVPDRFGDGRDAETTGNCCTWSHWRRRSPLCRGAAEDGLHAAAPSPAGNQPPELQQEPWGILKAPSSRRFVLNSQCFSSRLYCSCFWPEILALELFDLADVLLMNRCCCFRCAAERPESFATGCFSLLFVFGCENLLPTPLIFGLRLIWEVIKVYTHLFEKFKSIITLFISFLLPHI